MEMRGSAEFDRCATDSAAKEGEKTGLAGPVLWKMIQKVVGWHRNIK